MKLRLSAPDIIFFKWMTKGGFILWFFIIPLRFSFQDYLKEKVLYEPKDVFTLSSLYENAILNVSTTIINYANVCPIATYLKTNCDNMYITYRFLVLLLLILSTNIIRV